MMREHLSPEIKQKVFRLTDALYRVTDLFPVDEPLAYELRRQGGIILRLCASYSVLSDDVVGSRDIAGNLRGMRALLWLARSVGCVSPVNISVLEREYFFLERFFMSKAQGTQKNKELYSKEDIQKKEIKKRDVRGTAERTSSHVPEHVLKNSDDAGDKGEPASKADSIGRHGAILSFLKDRGGVGIQDIAGLFGGVSTKTIQRDLNALIQIGRVERTGDRRWAVYALSPHAHVGEAGKGDLQ